MTTANIQFQLRRGLASEWTSVNPILASGEMGLETDTDKFKFGDGVLTWTALPYAGGGGGSGDYLPLAGGIMTGAIDWNENSQTAKIDIIVDPNSSTGDVFIVESDAGVQVAGPYVVLDTTNLQITLPGAQQDAAITVAGIDAFGVVSLGYTLLPPPAYSVTDTTAIPVVIKVSGAVPPTPWVFTGLGVTLGQALAAGTANIAFEGIFENPTTRTGTVEFGLRVNGGSVLGRDIVTQISANFLQTIAMAFPLLNAYADGDLLEIMARVTVNNNNAFSLTMQNSATDLGAMRISTAGGSGGGGGATNLGYVASPTNGVVTSDTGGDATLPLGNTTNAGLMSPAQNTKLAGIATGATANQTDAFLLARANHTGTQVAATISDFNSASRAQTEAALLAGTNITITPAGTGAARTLTISAVGGGGGGTVTDVGATAPVLSSGGTAPVISMDPASNFADGYLKSTDWNVFNNKSGVFSTLAGYGITNAYTKTESDANYPTKAGVGAIGTWGISISGNANTASNVNWAGVLSTPTTLLGYGITDAYTEAEVDSLLATKQPLDADLTAIAGLVGASGLLRKTAPDTWALDTSIYAVSGVSYTKAESDALYPTKAGVGATGTWSINISGTAGFVAWSGVTGTPTTRGGYGITDAQETLVNQVNIKSINGNSLLGSGDLTIGGGGGATNLGYIASPTNGTVTSDTGADATLPLVDATNAGLMTPAQNTKLAGIAAGATANQTDAFLLARANHTGTQTASTISDFNSASRAQTEAELLAGANITITPAGSGATRTLTITATSSGGTVTDVGATAPVTTTGGTAPVIGMPAATISVDGYLSATNFNTFNNKQNPATTLAGYGITDAYTKVQSDANYPTKAGAGATGNWGINVTGSSASCTGNAATASVATAVNDNGAGASLKMWYGTEAQFTAIPVKDATTLYFRSA